MIVRETIEINGKQYDYTYSDSGKRISRNGVSYDTAIDPLDSGRVYVESGEGVELTAEEALGIIVGGAV